MTIIIENIFKVAKIRINTLPAEVQNDILNAEFLPTYGDDIDESAEPPLYKVLDVFRQFENDQYESDVREWAIEFANIMNDAGCTYVAFLQDFNKG